MFKYTVCKKRVYSCVWHVTVKYTQPHTTYSNICNMCQIAIAQW